MMANKKCLSQTMYHVLLSGYKHLGFEILSDNVCPCNSGQFLGENVRGLKLGKCKVFNDTQKKKKKEKK